MTESAHGAAQALLHSRGLPQAWASQPTWRILDTHFDLPRFLAIWHAWQADALRPRLLHMVALTPQPPDLSELQAAQASSEQPQFVQELAGQWHGLLPGFHRLLLAQGQLALTLCVGELQPLLREQHFQADTVLLDADAPWDRWSAKALARCCRRGTALVWVGSSPGPNPTWRDVLGQNGFVFQDDQAQYAPPWELKSSREPLRTQAAAPATCAVIGAGLAGASVAAALARRGWQVQVFDTAAMPATGASGLPAGLVVPHVSADDSPRSRLSRAGVRLMLQEARRLLPEGVDWALSGVLEQRLDGRAGLPEHWPAAGREISRPARPFDGATWHEGTVAVPALWHAQAAWIKPARLVQAWLAQPGVQFCGNAKVSALRKSGTSSDATWQLLDRDGQLLGSANQVVLANASDAPRLLDSLRAELSELSQLPPVHEMRGVLSAGLRHAGDEAALPPFPVNGLGALIPSVPTEDGLAWYAGATYEAAHQPPAIAAEHHSSNLAKLRTLLPAAARTLAPAFAPEAARGWGGTRCVSADRLPLVGPLEDGAQPTLWINAAMGSRGLSFSLLCAELLAARLGAEPWPVEASLAHVLHARRRPASSSEDLE
ncbi:MAG: FAD-dependent 5-carboxymethylaminomethyl-2-thiouridine(34) oxidoreductase MnmC [Hylemonella sp.]|nr:FAD-dependent 5-carboxymethylaminomethyl-2-thiouridine(34) oxidoreductase MnmC [Hylemonella sp.]MDP1935590.1 FAD-dependent 5-carboxymethylaminomethyl-2-thiouridine(34) oxidoreductase MnmC [Hylemonella sp.]